MNVAAALVLDVQRHLEQDVQAFLDTHGADVTDQIRLAVLQLGLGSDRLNVSRSGPLRTTKTSAGIEAATLDRQIRL